MPLPSRSQTNTMQSTKSAKSAKSAKSSKTRVGSGDKSEKKSNGDIENQNDDTWSFDDDPKTAPQECTLEQALDAAYLYPYEAVLKAVGTDPEGGLSSKDVKARQQEYGSNELEGGETVSIPKILVRQVANAMTFCLILAMAVSFGIQTWIEGGVLAAIIVANITIGGWQEYRAEQTMDSLRNLASPTARVIRGGNSVTVSAQEVCIGDIVEVTTGDTVPADLRLIEAMNFEADEALLTGESLPVNKIAKVAYGRADGAQIDVGVGDRVNMAYSSSNVTKGRAVGLVVAIGMQTEVGRVAEALRGAAKNTKIREVKRNAHGKAGPHRYAQAGALTVYDQVMNFVGLSKGTPLQIKLSALALLLLALAILFAIIVFLANLNAEVNPWSNSEVAIYAVATGVSIIPASLTAVLIICLSTGSQEMARQNVVVRKLESLEALGAITDICSDKTGTLTQGRMVLRQAWIPASGTFDVEETSEPFNPTTGSVGKSAQEPRDRKGEQSAEDLEEVTDGKQGLDKVKQDESFMSFLRVASLCNLATVFKDKESGEWTAHGDPTECAIQTFACRFGYSRQSLTKAVETADMKSPQRKPEWEQICEMPFSSDLKRMAVTFKQHRGEHKTYGLMKGAVERVLDCCDNIQTAEGVVKKSDELVQQVLENMESIAALGLRVLALAHRELSEEEAAKGEEIEREEVESKMTLVGLVGLYDPPRKESVGAVKLCHDAGITVHMLTGDHLATARAIAKQIGIIPKNEGMLSKEQSNALVMAASQFDRLSEQDIDQLPVLPAVIARCSPQTKVRMIEAIHRRGRLTAMTGDGVNDAPSLKLADIGIAMGQAGSDVAKDASDLTLSDDNFASITNAIREGRRLADNIQSFVLHLLCQNVCQACVLLIGLAFKDSSNLSVFPLSSLEVLYVIIVTSSLPAMALGLQAARDNTMRRPPADLKRGIFTNMFFVDLIVYGLWMSALCLGTFLLCQYAFGDGDLGVDCNSAYNETCKTVFQSRAATFAVMVNLSLLLAWQLVDGEASFFNAVKEGNWMTRWWYGSWGRNKYLFIIIVVGIATEFPIIYIPGLRDVVFLHTYLSWHWAVIIPVTILFFAGAEVYKWMKRVFFRRMASRAQQNKSDAEKAIENADKAEA
ncbi:unnamed protein product [Sympodiomycopsis kandeliae]